VEWQCGPSVCGPSLCHPSLCDPSLCDPSLCDPSLCDPSLCDPSLCDPSLCDPSLCDPSLCDPSLCDPSLCNPSLCGCSLISVILFSVIREGHQKHQDFAFVSYKLAANHTISIQSVPLYELNYYRMECGTLLTYSKLKSDPVIRNSWSDQRLVLKLEEMELLLNLDEKNMNLAFILVLMNKKYLPAAPKTQLMMKFTVPVLQITAEDWNLV
jgi:hypothetical protein